MSDDEIVEPTIHWTQDDEIFSPLDFLFSHFKGNKMSTFLIDEKINRLGVDLSKRLEESLERKILEKLTTDLKNMLPSAVNISVVSALGSKITKKILTTDENGNFNSEYKGDVLSVIGIENNMVFFNLDNKTITGISYDKVPDGLIVSGGFYPSKKKKIQIILID